MRKGNRASFDQSKLRTTKPSMLYEEIQYGRLSLCVKSLGDRLGEEDCTFLEQS